MALFRKCCYFVETEQVQEVRDLWNISNREALEKWKVAVTQSVLEERLWEGSPSAIANWEVVVINKESLLALIVDVM